jgi:hypothetical protein
LMKKPEVQTRKEEQVRQDLAAVKRTLLRKSHLEFGRDVLLDLANLGDRDCQQFRQRWQVFLAPAPLEQDGGRILAWRDKLRKVWSAVSVFCQTAPQRSEDQMCAILGNEVGVILDSWMEEVPYDSNQWHMPLWIIHRDFMEPNPGRLGFVLALTIRDLWSKLGHCPNPECPHPYFIKGRKNQRFCDRPACAAHGQREHKRKWWKERGEEWRQKWEKVRRSQSKRQKRSSRKGKK